MNDESDPRIHTNQREDGKSAVSELILKDEVYQIVGAALDVYYQRDGDSLSLCTRRPLGLNCGEEVYLSKLRRN